MNQVLDRDHGWLSYYKDNVSSTPVSEEDEAQAVETDDALLKGALAEAKFAAKMWDDRPELAREELGPAVPDVAAADRRLAGWYSVQIGHTFECENDVETASKHYADARSRTFFDIALPHPTTARSILTEISPKNDFHVRLLDIFSSDKRVGGNPWDEHAFFVKKVFETSATSNQHEEAVRLMGEVLGFTSSRPEQESDSDSTLDVLWLHNQTKAAILWSLKTKKKAGSILNSDEIGMGLQHLNWFDSEFSDFRHRDLFFWLRALSVLCRRNLHRICL